MTSLDEKSSGYIVQGNTERPTAAKEKNKILASEVHQWAVTMVFVYIRDGSASIILKYPFESMWPCVRQDTGRHQYIMKQ